MDKPLHLGLNRRLVFECNIECLEDLHVGIERGGAEISGADAPFHRDSSGKLSIPGSSIRGVLRGHVTRLLSSISMSSDDDLKSILEGFDVLTDEETIRGFVASEPVERDAKFADLGIIHKLFGVSGFASPLRITDAWCSSLEPATRRRVHVSIDIDSDMRKAGALTDLEAAPSGTTFAFTIIFDELSDERMAVANRIFYRLTALLASSSGAEFFFGGWKSRGYGRSRLTVVGASVFGLSQLLLGENPAKYEGKELRKFLLELTQGGKQV